MSEVSVRPRIREEVALSPSEVKNKLTEHIANYENELLIHQGGNHCTITIHQNIHHFWSPQASINIEETENGSIVRGLIGPRPNLWATFMVIYVFGIAGFITSLVIGYSLVTLNKSGLILYLSPLFLLVILANYFATYTGKTLGREQSKLIKDFIHKAL